MTNPDPQENGCTADQWFTSAAAAMAFAGNNWDVFCDYMENVVYPGAKVPIDAATMLHHARHVLELSDPERMPA